jgi:hypothetical protein
VLSSGIELVPAAVEDEAWATGPIPERRVSWIPGADGAPRDVGLRWLWELECELDGAMRIAYMLCELFLLEDRKSSIKESKGYCRLTMTALWRCGRYELMKGYWEARIERWIALNEVEAVGSLGDVFSANAATRDLRLEVDMGDSNQLHHVANRT